MKFEIKSLQLLALVVAIAAPAFTATATPAFSRQTQTECRTCHFMDMHGLNKFGREFKQNAFVLSTSQKEWLRKHRRERHKAEEQQ